MNKKNFFEGLAIIVGSMATYLLSIPSNSVFAASAVGLAFGFLSPVYAMAAYIGAFVGMSSHFIIPNLIYLVLASFFSSVFSIVFSKMIPSLGGKAGFIAFVGVMGASFLIPESGFSSATYPSETIVSTIFVAMAATIATFALRSRIREMPGEAVIGSALVGLAAGAISLFLPGLLMLSAVAYSASFAGMTDFKYLKKDYYPVIIGLIVGVVFFLSIPFFEGFGGKLGTIAFLSMILFVYLTKS